MASGAKKIANVLGTELLELDNGGATHTVATAQQVGNLAGIQQGTATANGATAVPVADVRITTNSVVLFGLKTVGGTPGGQPYMSAVTPGTGFSIKSVAGDTSVYNYVILN